MTILTSYPTSTNFCPIGWIATSRQLELNNEASDKLGREILAARKAGLTVSAYREHRSEAARKVAKVTVAQIEAAKVVNREVAESAKLDNAATLARLMGLTVKSLRSLAKFDGLTGYSKLRKAELAAMLVPYEN